MSKIDIDKFVVALYKELESIEEGVVTVAIDNALEILGYMIVGDKIVRIEPEQDYHLTGIGSKEATGKLKKMIDKVKQDEQNTDNLHQYLYGTLTEFEQCLKSGTNIYVEQGRHMEDWDAKSDAKELLEIARRTILEEEIELAYKTRDDMQFQKGYEAGYEYGRKQSWNVDVDEMVLEFKTDGNIHPCDFQIDAYKKGINDVIKLIKEE